MQPAAGPAAGEFPRSPPRLPHPGEDNARVVRVEAHVGGAGVLVEVQDILPGFATVPRAEDAAVLARAKRIAKRRSEGRVRITRMNDDRPDLADALPDVLPTPSCIDGAVNTIPGLN